MRAETEPLVIRRVGVVGLGLIGGSIARTLNESCYVVGFDSHPATRQQASAGGIDVTASLAELVADGVDVIFVATPIPAFASVFSELATSLDGPAPLVSDVGSVKMPIQRLAGQILGSRCRYLGGHPMAGTEHSGFEASSPTLFQAATWVLCIEPDTQVEDVLRMTRLLTGFGAQVVPLRASEHDSSVALISHVPHVIAAALQLVVDRSAQRELLSQLAAGSFRDATRVTGSRPALVAEMCSANANELLNGLEAFEALLHQARVALSSETMSAVERYFSEAHEAHEQVLTADATDAWGATHSLRIDLRADVRTSKEELLGIGRGGGSIMGVDEDSGTGSAVVRYRLPRGIQANRNGPVL